MNTIRRIFLILFTLSTLGVLMLLVFSQPYLTLPMTQEPGIAPTPSTGNPGAVDPPSQNSRDINFTALIGSVITSATSLIGLITTTVITWRKEKREASLADVQRKKLETELEKTKFELEELKKSRERKSKK